MINEVSNLILNYRQYLDDYYEVAIDLDLPQRIKDECNLHNYQFSVRFFDNGFKIIYLWDEVTERYRDELWCSDEVLEQIIAFAEQYYNNQMEESL